MDFAIETVSLGMRFGDFIALEDVSIRFRPGTVHALLGENGAGKSTLVKCLIGYQKPSSGQFIVLNKEADFASPRQAHEAGLGMVYQHFTLAEQMTVAENFLLVRDPIPLVVDWPKEKQRLSEFMNAMPFKLDIDTPVSQLSAGEKQKLEILKELFFERRILILDEPTSVLTPQEADEVLGLLRKMATETGLLVILITHKFREVSGWCDMVSVLRKGRHVGTVAVAESDNQRLAAMMVGDNEDAGQSAKATPNSGHTSDKTAGLSITDLILDTDLGRRLDKLNLTLSGGEILGIAGISGNGQRELVEILSGIHAHYQGAIRISGAVFNGSRKQLRVLGLNIIPELPLQNSCVGRMSLSHNLAFRDYDLPPLSSKAGFLMLGRIEAAALDKIAEYGIRSPGPAAPIEKLSGGNIQRAVLARELRTDTKVLVLYNPCFGLDFGASAFVHAKIREARARGAAVLLISEDLDEVIGLSDRLCVISSGRIALEGDPKTLTTAEIGLHMAGHQVS